VVDHQIEITIGPNIQTAGGDPWNPDKPERIYYTVSAVEGAHAEITNWSAQYDTRGTITAT
jgi:hypothetical protein